MSLASALIQIEKLHPDRPAVARGRSVVYTYRQLTHLAQRVAARLHAQGLRPGDRVVIYANNSPQYVAALWGIWWGGCVAVPANAKLHVNELIYILDNCEARVVLSDAGHAASLRAGLALAGPGLSSCDIIELEHLDAAPAAESFEPADVGDLAPVWLFYTSGTTGRPKGVTLAKRQLDWMIASYVISVGAIRPSSSMLHAAPLSHGSGMYHLPYVCFGGLNVIPESTSFDPAECLALAHYWKETSIFVAPTMVNRLVDAAASRSMAARGCFESIVYGGAPMYVSDIKVALETFGPHLVQVYGQGESPMTITALTKDVINDASHPRHEQRLASVGLPLPMFEVKVHDEDHRELPCGTPGEVVIRGGIVMSGYWKDAGATSQTVVNGWLKTGDIGVFDSEGFLTLLDRSKDMLISGGTNIYPREIEEVLLTHPAVKEVSVVGRRDPEWGEVPVACVVLEKPATAEELDDWCLDHIARFKRPRDYRFLPSLPKNNYGKTLKTDLRKLVEGDLHEAKS